MKKPKTNSGKPSAIFIVETVIGIESHAQHEIERLIPQAKILRLGQGEIEISAPSADRFQTLQMAQAVNAVERFAVSRPRALLGDEHFRRLTGSISAVAARADFRTLYLAAAGADSPMMMRLKHELSAALGLISDESGGDLWIRIRPTFDRSGWEVLIRLTPRPLATRAWRVRDMEGALNATVAQALIDLTQPSPADRVLNMGSGSGTLLIERAAKPAALLVGVDHDARALDLARANITASGAITIRQLHADVRALPCAANTFDVLLADLPFGQRVGSHVENTALYPAWLNEAARVATPNARFACITHEIKLMDRLLRDHPHWRLHTRQQIVLRGLHPCLYLLHRG